MQKKLIVAVAVAIGVILSSCSLLQVLALKDCSYSYDRVSDISFMGMKTSELTTIVGAAKVAAGLLGKSDNVPLGLTIHLKVDNPNQTTASMERLYYKVSMDSVEVADGYTTQPFLVQGGTSADLPLQLNLDLKNLMQSEKRTVLGKAIKNLVGLTADPTNITVQLKPTVNLGGTLVTSPAFIPVSFQYTGR